MKKLRWHCDSCVAFNGKMKWKICANYRGYNLCTLHPWELINSAQSQIFFSCHISGERMNTYGMYKLDLLSSKWDPPQLNQVRRSEILECLANIRQSLHQFADWILYAIELPALPNDLATVNMCMSDRLFHIPTKERNSHRKQLKSGCGE